MVKKVNQKEFKEQNTSGRALVDFSATWCGPCKMLAPVLEELSEEMPEVTFYNIDVDENMEIASSYGISSIPALILFEDGEAKHMMVGFRPKEEIKDFIEGK